jgi:hypothetical protein
MTFIFSLLFNTGIPGSHRQSINNPLFAEQQDYKSPAKKINTSGEIITHFWPVKIKKLKKI